jgi:hypothetical protein
MRKQNYFVTTNVKIASDSPMSAVLENFPGAQRALFRHAKPLAEFRSKD